MPIPRCTRLNRRGRNNAQFFTAEMDSCVRERLSIENDLRHALERNELRLFYQPRVDCRNGRLMGVEALIRWQHPQQGTDSAPALHHGGRGIRPDRPDRRLDHRRGLSPAGRLARPGCRRHRHLDQPVSGPVARSGPAQRAYPTPSRPGVSARARSSWNSPNRC